MSIGFLGIVERYQVVEEQGVKLNKLDLLGLKCFVLSYVYPVSLSGQGLVFALSAEMLESDKISLYLVDPDGKTIANVDIGMEKKERGVIPPSSESVFKDETWLPIMPWTTVVLPGDKFGLIRVRGRYTIEVEDKAARRKIGELVFAVVHAQPLTDARIAALKADPQAVKSIRYEIRCMKCDDKLRAYAGLEQGGQSETEGYVWYRNLPEQFKCSCGTEAFDVSLIKANLHGLLGSRGQRRPSELDKMYEDSALRGISKNLAILMNERGDDEGTFQRFFEENKVLLHQFTPEELIAKAPILTQFQTDFAIVNPQKELILVEIEKPATKLIKKDGGLHSELQHAFDQADSWLMVCREHWLAVLECMGVGKDRVASVRAVVIAGRDEGYDKEVLRRFKGRRYGEKTLYTYDDILNGFDSLIAHIGNL